MMGSFFLQSEQPAESLIVPDSVQKAQLAETVDKLVHMDYQQLLTDLASSAVWVLLKIVLALVIYLIGRWLLRRVLAIMKGALQRRAVDVSLQAFLHNLVKVVGYTLLILTIIQILGINTTSIIALLASAGLAIGMALSGTFQNFAGGVMILLLKPYRVGDYISAQGQSGTVEEIMLFSTKLATPDNQTIYIPNSAISTAIIDNYSTAATRRVDWSINISYGDDVDAVRAAILEMLAQDPRVLKSPAAEVFVSQLAAGAVTLSARAWVANADYWAVFFEKNELFYKNLPAKGAHFPVPKMNVHLNKE